MNRKIVLLSLAILFITTSLLTYTRTSHAADKSACDRMTIFPCREEVELMVLQTFQPMLDVVAELAGQTTEHERRIDKLEEKVTQLEARLKPTISPTLAKPSPTLTPTSILQPSVVIAE